MLRFIALRGVREHKNVALLQHRLNVIYGDRSRAVELLLQLKINNKSRQIMWRLHRSKCICNILVISVT